MESLTMVLVALMASWVPPSSDADAERYEGIARDIATVSMDAPLYPGDDGQHTAVTLAAIASLESFYRDDVDAFVKLGDGGRAWGLLQVHLLPGERCDTRLACLRLGLERVRLSMATCRRLPEEERLSQFTSGRCQTNAESRWRHYRARRAWHELSGQGRAR